MRNEPSAPVEIQSRRAVLKLFPLGIAVGIFGPIAAAAFRFLRPVVSATVGSWIDVAPVSEITGTTPVARTISAEEVAGWAASTNEHIVYILPENKTVLSGVCPHEGCEVTWDSGSNRFSCPCHESFFAADGMKLSGPASRGLDPLPSRVEDGKLQIQFRFYENNSQERSERA